MDSSEAPKLRFPTTGLAGQDFVPCRSTNFRAVPAGGGCAGAWSRQTGARLPRWRSHTRRGPASVFLGSHYCYCGKRKGAKRRTFMKRIFLLLVSLFVVFRSDGGVTPGGGPPVFFWVPIIAIVASGKVRKGGQL